MQKSFIRNRNQSTFSNSFWASRSNLKAIMKFLLITLLAAAASASFAPIYNIKEKIDGSYIVVLKDDTKLSDALSTIRNNPFFSTLGGRIEREFGTVLNGFSATLSVQALNFIRRLDFVKYVEENGIVRAYRQTAIWNLDRIDKHYEQNAYDQDYSPCGDGSNTHIYVIDTGINPSHVDFGGRATADADFCARSKNGIDCNGHGTHCAATAAGTEYGVATKAQVHGVRALNCIGSGSYDGIIAAMNWVADNGERPAVASMSLGGGASSAIDDAVSGMDAAGIIVVVAAGNDNADAIDYSPARAPAAFTVGATANGDKRSYFSNYGSCVNILAPGSSITSAWYTSDTATNTISGTSMACPHVAGAAAVALGIRPDLVPSEIKQEVCKYATPNAISDIKGSADFFLYVGDLLGTA